MSAAISFARSDVSLSPTYPTPQSALEKRLLDAIENLKLQVLNQSHNLRITCPITHEVMKDPVKSRCGHVYERTAIKSGDSCITCNSKIDNITPDTSTFSLIEELKKDFVPTLDHFQATNLKTAQLCLILAKGSMDQGKHTQALSFLKKVFIHAKSSTLVYANVPKLYDRLGDLDNALIARLYLSLYQLRDDKPRKAIESLALYTSSIPYIKTLFIAFSILGYPSVPKVIQNAKNYAFTLKETNPSDSAFVYRQILAHNPNDLEVQRLLSSLS
jgi:hypothetical protein